MTSKREKLQYAYVFFADLLTMAVSVLLAWLITDGLFGVLIPYTSTDWLQTLCLLFVAFVVTFFFFDQDKNIVTRSENEEISLSLRFNIAFGLVYAGCMLLAKATMLDSRYFAVTVPAVNAVLLPFSHAILKRLLIRFQRSWGMETHVGVVTTSDRAERLIPEIQKDWSRRVVGVSLLRPRPPRAPPESAASRSRRRSTTSWTGSGARRSTRSMSMCRWTAARASSPIWTRWRAWA